MENASKALLIAGAILIAIALISVGMLVLNSTTDVTDQVGDVTTSQAAQAFNSRFIPYTGKQKSSAVRALLGEIAANNQTNSARHKIKVTTLGPGSLINEEDNANNIVEKISWPLKGHNYNVEITRVNHEGYIEAITIRHLGM